MALSSQGGLNFHQSRLQDSTESARGALTEFGSLAQKFQDNKLKAEALAEAKAQQAIENARADRAEAMQKEQFDMRKKEFDTMQNTLRATALGTTTFDKAALGQALLDKQAASIGGSDGNGNFQNKLLQESQALAAKYQPTTNADGTSTAVEMSEADANRFKAIQEQLGAQADKMIAANKGNMQVQKQLIGEVGNQYFKEGEDGPMLYDPTSLNKYKQDLLQGLDTRIDREAARAQADEHLRLQLAQSERNAKRQLAQQAAAIKRQEKLDEQARKNAELMGYIRQHSMLKTPKEATYSGAKSTLRSQLSPVASQVSAGQQKALQQFTKEYGDDYDVKIVGGRYTAVPKASTIQNKTWFGIRPIEDFVANRSLQSIFDSNVDVASAQKASDIRKKIADPASYGLARDATRYDYAYDPNYANVSQRVIQSAIKDGMSKDDIVRLQALLSQMQGAQEK